MRNLKIIKISKNTKRISLISTAVLSLMVVSGPTIVKADSTASADATSSASTTSQTTASNSSTPASSETADSSDATKISTDTTSANTETAENTVNTAIDTADTSKASTDTTNSDSDITGITATAIDATSATSDSSGTEDSNTDDATTTDTNSSTAAIIKDSTNTTAEPTANGVSAYSQFKANGETGSVGSSTGSNKDLINVDVADDLAIKSTLTNDSDSSVKVNDIYLMPKAYATSMDTVTVNVSDESTFNVDPTSLGLTVTYSGTSGKYVTLNTYLDSYTWADLLAIQAKGTMAADSSLEITTPVTVSGLDTVGTTDYSNTVKLRTYNYGSTSKGTTNTVQAVFGQEIPVTYTGFAGVTTNADGSYSNLNTSILSSLGVPADSGLLKYKNFNDETDYNATTLYSGSRMQLDLSAIKELINSEGYSVAIDASGSQNDYYLYNNNVAGAYMPVEIRQVLDTSDSTLTVGDTWNANDNLVSATSPLDKTSDVTDEITETNNIDTSKAGTYTVTYSYKLNDGEYITKTATVTVKAPTSSSSGSGSDTGNTGDSAGSSDADTSTDTATNDDDTSTDTPTDDGEDSTTDTSTDDDTGASTNASTNDDSNTSSTVTGDASLQSSGTVTESVAENNHPMIATPVQMTNKTINNHPTKPAVVSSATDSASVQATNLTSTKSTDSQATTSTVDTANRFPQTGEQGSTTMTIWGMILAAVSSLTGFILYKKH